MLEYNEVKPGKFIVLEGVPYDVPQSHVFRKQQRKPVNDTKLRNLITGKVVEHSFHQSDKVEEAEIEEKEVIYLYHHRDEYWFCDKKDRSKRFELPADLVAAQMNFVKLNTVISLLSFRAVPMG